MNNIVQRANSRLNAVMSGAPASAPAINTPLFPTTMSSSLPFFIGAVLILFFLIVLFHSQLSAFFLYWYDQLRTLFGAAPTTAPAQIEVVESSNDPATTSIVEKVLPGHKEVFNVASNRYTYTDAEPLCKALGAELATYDQVKSAWDSGADWCNYGWVKGQQAVYPTQTETWEKVQSGSEDQRNSCGRPGVNGGYFDNPELRFGVNCYGAKPPQNDHDITQQVQGAPKSPGTIEFDNKVAHFKGEANTIGLNPFSSSVW